MQFRILIVDDEEVIRNSIALYLRREDYQVDVCATGEEGLSKRLDPTSCSWTSNCLRWEALKS